MPAKVPEMLQDNARLESAICRPQHERFSKACCHELHAAARASQQASDPSQTLLGNLNQPECAEIVHMRIAHHCLSRRSVPHPDSFI